jgi:hypothetical protein
MHTNFSGIIAAWRRARHDAAQARRDRACSWSNRPVPVDEIEAVELDGSNELVVDGDSC